VSAQRSHDTEILRALAARVTDLLMTVPITPEKRIQVPLTKAFDGLYHLALERQPPHLAVRQQREAGLFLLGDRFVYGPVLDALVGWSGDLAGAEALLGGQQPRRPQQAPDDISMRRDHALLPIFPRTARMT
jgi:hypothetical protein